MENRHHPVHATADLRPSQSVGHRRCWKNQRDPASAYNLVFRVVHVDWNVFKQMARMRTV